MGWGWVRGWGVGCEDETRTNKRRSDVHKRQRLEKERHGKKDQRRKIKLGKLVVVGGRLHAGATQRCRAGSQGQTRNLNRENINSGQFFLCETGKEEGKKSATLAGSTCVESITQSIYNRAIIFS